MLLSHRPKQTGDDQRSLRTFFSVFGMMLTNSSAGTLGLGWTYTGPHSLDRARRIATRRLEEIQRGTSVLSSGYPFLEMMDAAAATKNQDYAVADFLKRLAAFTSAVDNQLSTLEARSDGGLEFDEEFATIFTSGRSFDFDVALGELSRSWKTMKAPTQLLVLRWLGRAFAEDGMSYSTIRYDYRGRNKTTVRVYPSLPELSENLGDYLNTHRGEATDTELTDRYHEQLAGKLLRLFGVDTERPTSRLPRFFRLFLDLQR